MRRRAGRRLDSLRNARESIHREDWFGAAPDPLSRTVSFTSQLPSTSP
jgi:hypothetical protein